MSQQHYTYSHPRPIMAADSTVFTLRDGRLSVLLIRRGHEPFENHWAIPGGFVHENEPLDAAAARELEEETGLANLPLRQIYTCGDPGRDPRGWAVSVVYLALIDWRAHTLSAGDDAREAEWFSLRELPPLAFDHGTIVSFALRSLREAVVRGGDGIVPPSYKAADCETLKAALNAIGPKEGPEP